MKIRPMQDWVLVRKPREVTYQMRSGIMLPAAQSELATRAEVLAVGPGFYDRKGKFHPQTVKVGDQIVLGRYSGVEYYLDEERVWFVPQDEIKGIIEGEEAA